MVYIYKLIVFLADRVLPPLGVIHPGIRQWVNVRTTQVLPQNLIQPVWIHCASLGEFEQGRPLIEAIKKEWPAQQIILTFFSRSGYDIRKNYDLADWVGYLPLDTPAKAEKFVSSFQPKMAIFVRYEFWYHHMAALIQRNIPYFFISSKWTNQHYLLKWQYRWLRNQVFNARMIFVQDIASKEKLASVGFKDSVVAGDTRVDRVVAIARQGTIIPELEKLKQGLPILVAGSTWPEDDQLLLKFFSRIDSHRLIIVPHEPVAQEVQRIIKSYEYFKPIRFSTWTGQDFKVMILDKMGVLNKLYAYAQVAFVGGGFGKGIHNILEAAVYGIPVFFGPNHTKFKEAHDLIALRIGFTVSNEVDMWSQWDKIIPSQLPVVSTQAAIYFKDNEGATARIIDYLRPLM